MSHLSVDVEGGMNMPGGIGFIDATDIITKGTNAIDVGAILSMDGFTLQDAMSALEIMDARMDTGMAEPPPPFDPHMPLLPSEVCWILDRAVACEMNWHSGLSLSQTVYTLRYIHHLMDISYPRFNIGHGTRAPYMSKDPERPIELVTLVLRAGVFGLLKCCDLVWRELANDHLVDGEDWSGEKFGVSLCENVQSETLMILLNQALSWLQESPSITSSPWRTPLLDRISLRKNVFQTLAFPSFSAIPAARKNIEWILSGPVPPEPPTMIKNVFDPAISRRLVTFAPTHVIELPPQIDAWNALLMWLDGWEEVHTFVGIKNLRDFKMLASLRACKKPSPRRSAFLRSLSISTFFNGQKILVLHDPPWLIDRYFWETAGVDAAILSQLEGNSSEKGGGASTSFNTEGELNKNKQGQASNNPLPNNADETTVLFEKGLAKLLVDLFNSFFHNRARQRRKLAASILDWHLAFDQALVVVEKISPRSSLNQSLSRVPLCVRNTRLNVITDVVFAGFELELYSSEEWPMMYWYAGQLLTTQVALLEEIRSSMSSVNDVTDSHESQTYVSFQLEFTEALQCFSIAMRDILYHYAPAKAEISASRERANFERRFKWAFVPGYQEAAVVDDDKPSLRKWREWQRDCGGSEKSLSEASDNLIRAQGALSHLVECEPAYSGSVLCTEAYREFIAGLVKVCTANIEFVKMPTEVRNETRREWLWTSSTWFPEVHLFDIPP